MVRMLYGRIGASYKCRRPETPQTAFWEITPVTSRPRRLALSRPNRYVWAWPRPSDDCCRERRPTGNRPVPGVDEQSIRTRNSDLRGVRPMVEMLWPGPAGGCSGGLFVIQCGPEVPEQRGTGLETNRTEARL